MKLFIDIESFYDSKGGYDLRKLSIVEYCRDSRFKLFGMGVCCETGAPEWISGRDVPKYLTSIAKQYGWPQIAAVGHNIRFDCFALRHTYEVVPGQFICTRAMSKAVLGKSIKGHSLALIAEHFQLLAKGTMRTDGLGGKENLSPEQEAELAEYCLHDVELCRDIYNRLAPEFPENQYAALHRTVDMFVSPKMQLNVPLLQKTSIEEAARRANIFKEIGIDKSVFASNVKFPALLISKGYEVPTKPSPRKKDENGDPQQIPALALGDPGFLELLESPNEELKALCEARVAAKSTLLETRSAKLAAIGATGLWPFDVEFSGADQTHRFSGGSGAGGNPQNFTRGSALRTAVEAPSGYELVVGDFANIELRIVAFLSKDPGLMQAIEKGTDIYCDFASVFYGRKITKADKRERQFGKTAILGLGYGMGWRKFIRTVRIQTGETISEEDARKAVELYRTRYAKVPGLWQALDNAIRVIADPSFAKLYWDLPVKIGNKCLELPSGLKIRYTNLRQEPGERGHEWVYDVYDKRHFERRKLYGGKVLENISQAIAGEFCKDAMLQMGDGVTGLVHDEIHVRCRKGLGLVTAMKLKRVMSISPSWFPQIKLDAEVGVGTNWGGAK